MLVSEAANKLGMSTQLLRLALQQNKFDFGVAVKTSANRWAYYINPKRLERYINGEMEILNNFVADSDSPNIT